MLLAIPIKYLNTPTFFIIFEYLHTMVKLPENKTEKSFQMILAIFLLGCTFICFFRPSDLTFFEFYEIKGIQNFLNPFYGLLSLIFAPFVFVGSSIWYVIKKRIEKL